MKSEKLRYWYDKKTNSYSVTDEYISEYEKSKNLKEVDEAEYRLKNWEDAG